eukprot:GILI01012503.1.p1 GENE.GILI01012503.1~~GILI01012503.1.p1  ORF type:complete len:504 (-),score=116.79 GILI01012503.1:83-1594(-)
MPSDTSVIRTAQRQERLRDMMVSKIAKLIEHGTNRQAIATKQRRQVDDGFGGTLGSLTDQEISFVRSEVDRLIQAGDASEASLNRIAMQVRVAAKGPLPQTTKSKSMAEMLAGSAAQKAPRVNAVESLPSLNTSKVERPVISPDTLAATKEFYVEDGIDPWSVMYDKDKEEYNKEIIAQRRSNRKKESEQREFLDKQVQARQSVKKRLIEEEHTRAREDQRQIKMYEEQEQRAKEAIRRKHEVEKKMFEEQLALSKARKAMEEQTRREEEQLVAADIQQGIVEEKKIITERKIAGRAEVARFAQLNFANKDNYRIQKAKDADEDARLQQAFLDRLAKEEKAREDNLIKLHERMTRQMEMAHTIQKTMKEKSSDDERKANIYAAQKAAKEEAAQKAASEKVALEKMKLRQALALQVLEKEQRQAKLRTDDLSYKAVFNKEVEESQRTELERRAADRMRITKQKEILDSQMSIRNSQKHVVMSEAERQFNAKRLEQLSQPRARVE